MKNSKKILIAPLDWGLGHTTRCISLIEHLRHNHHTVWIGCTEKQRIFLLNEIGDFNWIALPSYEIDPDPQKSIWKYALMSYGKIGKIITKEHQAVCSHNVNFDAVLSDNRFGCWLPGSQNFLITHQANLIAPLLLKPFVNRIYRRFLKPFKTLLIPDFSLPVNRLSGKLSDYSKSHVFIGPLSRLNEAIEGSNKYDYCVLLSGPEKARALMERTMVNALKESQKTVILVGCISAHRVGNNIKCLPEMNREILSQILSNSKFVIARSGYSSIMDLVKIQKPCFLIPTLGQYEQEYLAIYLKAQFGVNYCSLAKFRIPEDVEFKAIPSTNELGLLSQLDELIA